jgi:F-type H+-transporting ATPase subunit gamma
MAELKEIKSRIQSVISTQKITSAMMMISSAKLRKTQDIIQNLYPYEQKLGQLLHIFLRDTPEFDSPFTRQRTVQRVAIVAFSSNTGLAGRFNHNIAGKLEEVTGRWLSLGKENIQVYPIGEKVARAARKLGLKVQGNYNDISEKPQYYEAQMIAAELMEQFRLGNIDRVELIYHHFQNKGSQIVVHEPFLPIELKPRENGDPALDYIVEPDEETIMAQLIPKVLKLKLFTTHIDSVTSEHAARMMAMQIATDNADELIDALTLEYNKLRQQSITNELLDIEGGSFGQTAN